MLYLFVHSLAKVFKVGVYQITHLIFIVSPKYRAAELTQDRCPASHFKKCRSFQSVV